MGHLLDLSLLILMIFTSLHSSAGFLDAFTDGKTIISKHGKKLAKVCY